MYVTYACYWDTCYDWDLGHRCIEHPLLRQHLAFVRVWPYYLVVVANAVLRFSWILYVVFPRSSLVSFGVSLAEVLRRGIWSAMRLEAAYCAEQNQCSVDEGLALQRDTLSIPGMTAGGSEHGTTKTETCQVSLEERGRPTALHTSDSLLSEVSCFALTKPNSAFLAREIVKEL